jgi:hypothetical protein
MMINARTSALRPGASRPSGARARPALAVVVRNNPVEKAAATSQAEANGVQEAGKVGTPKRPRTPCAGRARLRAGQ